MCSDQEMQAKRAEPESKGQATREVAMTIAYCERGAWRQAIKKLQREKQLKIIHFPYDPGDRLWHNKNNIAFARPSLVTMDTTEVRWSDDFLISEMCESEKYMGIARILHHQYREFDVRHFDSAYKSGAQVFISEDRNYSKFSAQLFELTKIQVIDPSRDEDIQILHKIINDNAFK